MIKWKIVHAEFLAFWSDFIIVIGNKLLTSLQALAVFEIDFGAD
jgi:hypothetical protein